STAISYYSAEPDRTEEVLRFWAAIWRHPLTRGHREPIAQLRAALARDVSVPAGLRGRAALAAATLVAYVLGNIDLSELHAGQALAEEAATLGRQVGDSPLVVNALAILSICCTFSGDIEQGAICAQEAVVLATALGDRRLMGIAIGALAKAIPERERELNIEALDHLHEAGDTWWMNRVLGRVSQLALDEGRTDEGRVYAERFLASAEELGPGIPLLMAWNNVATFALLRGEGPTAISFARRTLTASRIGGNPGITTEALFRLAGGESLRGNDRLAAELWGAFEVRDDELLSSSPIQGWYWPSWEVELREEIEQRLQQALGVEEFERLRTLGRSLRLQEACDLALSIRT
ncbi:MAG TPA: hypothetical protein VGS21_05910, partial [Acidimicrobiales bacterium]|nr:hypothetical protein [Acidimicrobiales bacterium]